MIISNLEHLEAASEVTNIVGGEAYANADSGAYAEGEYYSSTYTSTYTSADSSPYDYYYYGPNNSSSSGSYSSSYAD